MDDQFIEVIPPLVSTDDNARLMAPPTLEEIVALFVVWTRAARRGLTDSPGILCEVLGHHQE